jgi:hypothetical protein
VFASSCVARAAALTSVVVFAMTAAAPARAQDRLAIGLWEVVSSGGAFGATVGPSGALLGELADGGRFGLLYDRMINRLTGAQVVYPYPTVWSVVAADPARPRGFFTRARPLSMGEAEAIVAADLTTGALTTLVPITSPPGVLAGVSARFAVDAGLLFVTRPGPDPAISEWVVVDPDLGLSSLRVVPVPSPPAGVNTWTWTVTPDGKRLFRSEGAGPVNDVVVYDAVSGAELHRVTITGAGFGGAAISWSDALDGLILQSAPASETVFTLFTRDLQTVGAMSVPTWGKCGMAKLGVSAATGRVYTFTGDGNYFGVPFPSRLTAVTLGTSGPVDVADVAAAVKTDCAVMHVASPPGAPRRLRATVTGATVAFAWENVGGASQFTVDVGIAPGRTDLSIPLGPDSHWTIGGAPPGTYFVRVRGANTFGGGRASNEVQVVVR